MNDAVDLDGDGEIDEKDVLADNPESDLRLLEIISAACTSLCFTTAQAQHVMGMASAGPTPVWSRKINGRWMPWPTEACTILERGFIDMMAAENSPRSRSSSPPASRPASADTVVVQGILPSAASTTVQVSDNELVDLQRMVQISKHEHERHVQDQLRPSGDTGMDSFRFGKPVMREALHTPSPRVELLFAMFERLVDTEALPELTRLLSPEEIKQLRGKLGPLWYYDNINPGGHYGPFVLNSPSHRRVVELLLLREAKELETRANVGAVQLGRQLRVRVSGTEVKYPMRTIPRRGMVEMDFTTSLLGGVLRSDTDALAAADIHAASEEDFALFHKAVRKILAEKAGSEDGRMGQIRNAMKGLFFMAEQIVDMASSLTLTGSRMVDLVCIAWGRTINVSAYQSLALGSSGMFSETERNLAHERLAILFAFDPEFPDGTWNMNLAVEEDHRVAQMLVTLAAKEDGENWKDEYWSLAAVPETWSLPASWLEEVPREGMLSLCFITQRWPHGDVCIKTRAELCQRTFAAEARKAPLLQ